MIKEVLLEYTQEFAKLQIDADLRRETSVPKVRFNYTTETWETRTYDLPHFRGDYVLLTPKEILTKDDSWISHRGLIADFHGVVDSVPNEQLRGQLNNYFLKLLPAAQKPRKKEIEEAISPND